MPKIITIIPVKNDGWFIENSIRSAVEWSDYVFVADENSDDGSHEIYKKLEMKYENLKIIYNRPKFDFNTPDMRNYSLDLARTIDCNNIIFEIHADEIISAEILKPEIRNRLINDMSVGSALMMPWVNLWKTPLEYRDDKSVWSNSQSWFAYRDDGKVKFEGVVFHGPRAPESFLKNKVTINYLQVMHYQFVNLGMERSKQALYQIFERNHYPNQNIEYINKKYAYAFDEREMKLSQLEVKHYAVWIEKGIVIEEYPSDGYNWRDTEVLKNFRKYGLEFYKNLNIWYIDWEAKRQEALKLGITENIPKESIIDPRDISTRLAHQFLMKYQKYPFWRVDFYKLLVQKGIEKIKRKFIKNV